jgi:hypothetical protein
MSGPPPGNTGPPVRAGSNGIVNGPMTMSQPPRPNDGGLGGGAGGSTQNGAMSQQNLNQIVSEHILSILTRQNLGRLCYSQPLSHVIYVFFFFQTVAHSVFYLFSISVAPS